MQQLFFPRDQTGEYYIVLVKKGLDNMKYGVYAVRDVLNGFGTMLCDHNDNSAARSFRLAMNQDGAFPRDYDLYKIGTYDTDTGTMVPLDFPEVIVRGIDCVSYSCTE